MIDHYNPICPRTAPTAMKLAAHQAYDQLTNSPHRELKIFTDREGGVEHVGADKMLFGRDYIADWFAETLGGRTPAIQP